MKKVVVTGGAGFIGGHLVEELVRDDFHTVVVDDLSSGSRKNIENLLNQGKIEFIQDTVLNLSLLRRVFHGADYVFHQAAIPSVPGSIGNPLASHEVNVTGTLNVLVAARDNGVRKVVFASSCAVYGDAAVSPQREDSPLRPLSPYAVTKLAGEYYCQVFTQIYGLATACLRYFNVYGPRQDPDSEYAAVIPKFINTVAEKKPPVIFGDGTQTRDFIFVRDVVAANIITAKGPASGVINIGSGQSTEINRLAGLILENAGSNLKPVYREARAGDIKQSVADISRARSYGYEPGYDLKQGLLETYLYARKAEAGNA